MRQRGMSSIAASTPSSDTPASWSLPAARLLSTAVGPAAAASVLLLESGVVYGAPWAGLLALLFAAALPAGGLIALSRMGVIQDRHVSVQRERFGVFGGIVLSLATCIALLALLRAPVEVIAILLAAIAGLGLAALLNIFLKLSIHLAVATFVVGMQVAFFGEPGWITAVILPALAWSRVRLKAHTWPQVIVGSLAGVLILGLYLEAGKYL